MTSCLAWATHAGAQRSVFANKTIVDKSTKTPDAVGADGRTPSTGRKRRIMRLPPLQFASKTRLDSASRTRVTRTKRTTGSGGCACSTSGAAQRDGDPDWRDRGSHSTGRLSEPASCAVVRRREKSSSPKTIVGRPGRPEKKRFSGSRLPGARGHGFLRSGRGARERSQRCSRPVAEISQRDFFPLRATGGDRRERVWQASSSRARLGHRSCCAIIRAGGTWVRFRFVSRQAICHATELGTAGATSTRAAGLGGFSWGRLHHTTSSDPRGAERWLRSRIRTNVASEDS